MKLSKVGHYLTDQKEIVNLMEDLGEALNVNPDLLFLGGGNPAIIDDFTKLISSKLVDIASDKQQFEKLIGVYQSPSGSEVLVKELVSFFREQYGWDLSAKNIAITNGSQSAFFALFNMLAGTAVIAPPLHGNGPLGDGVVKRELLENSVDIEREISKEIVFPMMPEYLGYADQGIAPNMFRSIHPLIEQDKDSKFFKYKVDFSALNIDQNTAAICASWPTNPTGNLLTQDELEKLSDLAETYKIPFILDCAYGLPFPGIIYDERKPFWNENTILVLSLSKLGLPGVRTGIVVGDEKYINRLVAANTVMSLASGNLGPALLTSLLKQKDIPAIIESTLLPFYRQRRDYMLRCIEKSFRRLDDAGVAYAIHKPEGAFFLWVWFEGLKISSKVLYSRLKEQGVLIMDGEPFFYGLEDDTWAHSHECIRLSYCQSEQVIEQAIEIIADVLVEIAN